MSGEDERESGSLVWEDVSLTYAGPPPVTALQPTNVSIEPGAHVAITGPSGSGKSTLLNILGLLDRASTGRYLLGGHDVLALGDVDLAARRAAWFGFVFQRFHLIPTLSAVDNVELGLMYGGIPRRDRTPMAMEALERVGLVARARHHPSSLSGGEQQRVAIARAIVRDQRFLLADEPTGSLDSKTAGSVLELLDELVAEGRGLICVTHDEQVAARAARRITVLDGIVSDGGRVR